MLRSEDWLKSSTCWIKNFSPMGGHMPKSLSDWMRFASAMVAYRFDECPHVAPHGVPEDADKMRAYKPHPLAPKREMIFDPPVDEKAARSLFETTSKKK